jgi:hypothetical protein
MRPEVLFDTEAALLYETFDLELSEARTQSSQIKSEMHLPWHGKQHQHKRVSYLPAGNHRHGTNDESGAGCLVFWHLGKNETEGHQTLAQSHLVGQDAGAPSG